MLIGWCAERTIFMTRARPHTSNDNAHIEQKNGDIVHKSAFRCRYDTAAELALLNELWGFVNLRKNTFLPTKKANGWRTMKSGRSTRTYDQPRTPYHGRWVLNGEQATHPGRTARRHEPGGPHPQYRQVATEIDRVSKDQNPGPTRSGFVSTNS